SSSTTSARVLAVCSSIRTGFPGRPGSAIASDSGQVGTGPRVLGGGAVRILHRQLDAEAGAPRGLLQFQLAAVRRDNAPGDGQPEAGTGTRRAPPLHRLER